MIYTIRPNFTITKAGTVYTAGQQVDLTEAEFGQHKHKLEGVEASVLPIAFSLTSSTTANITFDDRTCNLVNGESNANLQSAIAALNSRLDAIEGNPGTTSGRKILTTDTTYYVDRALGNDTNSGEQSSPFATIKKALDLVDRGLDLGGYGLTIQMAEGDYTSEGLLHLPVITGGKAQTCFDYVSPNPQIRIVGAGENTIIAGFELDHFAYYSVENLRLTATDSKPLLTTQRNGVIEPRDVYFYGNSSYSVDAIAATDNGIIYLSGNLYFYNSWRSLFKAKNNGQVRIAEPGSCSLYISQSVISDFLLDANNNGFVDLLNSNFYIDFDGENK